MRSLQMDFTANITKPTAVVKEWRRLHADARKNAERLDALRLKAEEVKKDRDLASMAYRAAYAADAGKAQLDKLEAALAEAKARVEEPWLERIEASITTANDARDNAHRYASEHIDELIAELVPGAIIAQEKVLAGVELVEDGLEERRQRERELTAAIALKEGVFPRDLLPLDPVTAEMERTLLALRDIPPRVPGVLPQVVA